MFVTFFNSHAIKNQILIIVLEGTLRHKQTHKNNSFWVFQNNFSNFYQIFGFFCQNTLKLQNTLKTVKNSEKQH